MSVMFIDERQGHSRIRAIVLTNANLKENKKINNREILVE